MRAKFHAENYFIASERCVARVKQSIHGRHRDEEKSRIVARDHLSSSCSRTSVLIRLLLEIAERLKVIEQLDERNSKSVKKTRLQHKIDEAESQLLKHFLFARKQ